MRKLALILSLAVLLVLPAAASAADVWNVDSSHSQVTFEVRHFFTPVKGSFRQFEVELEVDLENPARSSVRATIPVASVSTGNDQRDSHLRSPDFFEAEAHPEMTFVSERVEVVSDDEFIAHGTLTIKGVARAIELHIEKLGVMELSAAQAERSGRSHIGSFRARTTIDRRDFGVGTGSFAETAVVGGDVEIEILVEASV